MSNRQGKGASARGRKSWATFLMALAVLALLVAAMSKPMQACEKPNKPSNQTDTPTPDCTDEPIVLSDGSVTEEATDVVLPGSSFGWAHTRSYSSSLSGGTYIQGEKWTAGLLTAFLCPVEGSDDLDLYMSSTYKRRFTKTGGFYTAPSDFPATLEADSGYFRLKLTQTGETLVFYDMGDWLDGQKGLLYQRTDRYGNETMTYNYSDETGGRISSVTTTQGYLIQYTYITDPGPNIGRLCQINVTDGTEQHNVLQRVKYTYYVSEGGDPIYSPDLGSDGDLIMVKVLQRSTKDIDDRLDSSSDGDFAIERITMYRYYSGGEGQAGAAHQLKMVFSPASVEQAMTAGGVSPEELLGMADNAAVDGGSGPHTNTYVNVMYTYYTSDYNTGDVRTTDGGVGGDHEDLQTKYGCSNLDETGFARSQTMYKDWRGYLGTRTYFYMSNSAGNGINDVKTVTVEDLAEAGTRTVYGINKDRQTLRKIFVDNPTGSHKYWCESYVMGETKDANTNNVNCITEHRMPSAHSCITDDDDVEDFLDATTTWTDTNIMNADTGVVYVYGYNAQGYVRDEMIKKGRSGEAYYLRAADYGDGSANKPTYLPTAVYEFPVAGKTSRDDASRLTTSYTYTFHDSGGPYEQIKTRTVIFPIVTAAQNGPDDTAISTAEYYDDRGRLRWTKDGEGHVNYYSYNADTGGLGYAMVDVETDDLPSAITGGSSPNWIAWGGGAAPFTHTDDGSLQLVTKLVYDCLGRQIKTEDAEGMVTAVAYCDNETRVYPGWNTASLPIRVMKTNDDDLTTEVFTLNPAGVTYGLCSSGLPRGDDTGQTQADYVTWTRYYYGLTALLQREDRYHSIPSSGDGAMSTNFYRTFYRYDSLGRQTHTIQVVSGTDETGLTGCVEQVSEVEYDKLGRTKAAYRGVSDSSHLMKTTTIYDTDPATLCKVAESFYDQATPGTGASNVGDGLITSTLAYFDAGSVDANHAVKAIYHYNWLGQLRGIESGDAPHTVLDVDNMGRTVAAAQYKASLTWSAVVTTGDYSATTATNRGTLSKTCYDNMGRLYASEIYSVDVSTGAAGNKILANYYYDRNSRLVGTYSAAKGAAEFAYDGTGRRTEVRLATDLEATKYASGAFNYRDPQPGATSGGDDSVVQVTRMTYDRVGDVTEQVTMEANHDDTNGLNLSGENKDFIQTTSFSWYDGVHRLTASAAYGTYTSTWAYADKPTRPANTPASSDTVLVTAYAYEPATARLSTVTDPKGIVTLREYDRLGRTIRIKEAYDPNDHTGERWTLMQYDGLSDVVKQIADTGKNDTFSDGLWTTESPVADSQVTAYTFGDPHNAALVTQIQYPDGDSADDNVKFAYNLDGSVATRTSQKKPGETAAVIAFDYDTAFRRLSKQRVTAVGTGVDGGVQSIRYTFDALGRADKVTSYSDNNCTMNDAVNEVAYEYNSLGALAKEYQAHSGTVNVNSLYVGYTYDTTAPSGVLTKGMRLTEIRYPNGRKSIRDYGTGGYGDKFSRLTAIKDDDGSTLATYSYNGAGRLVVESFVVPQVRLDYWGQDARTYSGFDRFGRTAHQLWRYYGGTPADLDEYGYGYDRNSNRTYRENAETTGKSELYAYDNLDRLVSYDRGDLSGGTITNKTRNEAWTLGATGNWAEYKIDANGDEDYIDTGDLNQVRTFNRANEIYNSTAGNAMTESAQQTAWADPAYDARGNMTSAPKPANMTGTVACKYDSWNRLVEVDDGQTVVATYAYDGLGRRISKTVGAVTYDDYFNASWQILEERKNGGATPYIQYVWSARYIDAPILRDHNTDNDAETGDLGVTDSGLEERLYYLTDANMNVTALVNTSGTVVERCYFDPYGAVHFMDASWATRGTSSYDNEILYCGYRLDTETGLYHVRNRVYHPLLGKWMQRDPMGYVDGMSVYSYVGCQPMSRMDPSGMWWGGDLVDAGWNFGRDQVIPRVGNAVIGGVTGAVTGAGAGAVTGAATGAVVGAVLGDGVGALPGAAAGAELGVQNGAISGGISGVVSGLLADPQASTGQVVKNAAISGAVGGAVSGVAGPLVGSSSGVSVSVGVDGGTAVLTGAATATGVGAAVGTVVGTVTAINTGNDGAKTGKEHPEAPKGGRETFKSPEDAIGQDGVNGVKEVGSNATKDADLIKEGFTEAHYYKDANGVQHTVFKNPKTGEYTGAHPSSNNP